MCSFCTGRQYKGYKAATSNYIIHHYGTVKSCYERCERTAKCSAFMYRHADSICWLYRSREKLKTQVIGVEFFDIMCRQAGQTSTTNYYSTNLLLHSSSSCIQYNWLKKISEQSMSWKKICPKYFYSVYHPSPNCITVISSVRTYNDAIAYCKRMGGHLSEYETLAETVAVEKFIRKRNERAWVGWYHVGFRKGKDLKFMRCNWNIYTTTTVYKSYILPHRQIKYPVDFDDELKIGDVRYDKMT